MNLKKLSLAFAVILQFSTECFSEHSIFVGKKTNITLSGNSKCKATSYSYHCFGAIKFDPANHPLWKKDPTEKSFYTYTKTFEPRNFEQEEKARTDFLHKACPDGFALTMPRSIKTCTDKGDEQEINFYYGVLHWGFICNAAGGTEVLKTIYPLAKWIEAHKMPHYYEADNGSPELEEALQKLHKKLPEGCHFGSGCTMDDCS